MPNDSSYQKEHLTCFTGKSKSKSYTYLNSTYSNRIIHKPDKIDKKNAFNSSQRQSYGRASIIQRQRYDSWKRRTEMVSSKVSDASSITLLILPRRCTEARNCAYGGFIDICFSLSSWRSQVRGDPTWGLRPVFFAICPPPLHSCSPHITSSSHWKNHWQVLNYCKLKSAEKC